MELKLNIYKNQKEIEKTYSVTNYDLTYGTIDDVLTLFDLDKLDNNVELIKVVIKSLNSFKPLLLDVFDGLTEEELRNTKVKELVTVIVGIAMTAKDQLQDEIKNVMGEHK